MPAEWQVVVAEPGRGVALAASVVEAAWEVAAARGAALANELLPVVVRAERGRVRGPPAGRALAPGEQAAKRVLPEGHPAVAPVVDRAVARRVRKEPVEVGTARVARRPRLAIRPSVIRAPASHPAQRARKAPLPGLPTRTVTNLAQLARRARLRGLPTPIVTTLARQARKALLPERPMPIVTIQPSQVRQAQLQGLPPPDTTPTPGITVSITALAMTTGGRLRTAQPLSRVR